MTNNFRIFHMSDLRLGYPFPYLPPSKGEQRQEDLKNVFSKIIELTKAEGVPLLLCSGNIFHDDPYVDEDLMLFVLEGFASLYDTQILITTAENEPDYFQFKWPSNVKIFQGSWERFPLPDLEVDIYGCNRQKTRENSRELLKQLVIQNPKATNIALLPAKLPLETFELQASGADYVALGGQNRQHKFLSGEKLLGLYPGNPEPLDWTVKRKTGIYSIDFHLREPQPKLIPLNQRHLYHFKFDASPFRDQSALIHHIQQHLPSSPEKSLAKIILQGSIPPEIHLNCEEIETILGEKFFHVEVINQTHPDYDIDNFKKESHTHQLFVEKINELLAKENSTEQKEIIKRALYYGMDSFIQGKVNYPRL